MRLRSCQQFRGHEQCVRFSIPNKISATEDVRKNSREFEQSYSRSLQGQYLHDDEESFWRQD